MNAGQAAGLQAGPSRLVRALVLAGCGAMTVTATACESTEQESAKLGLEAAKSSLAGQPTGPKLGAVNHSVEVSDVTFLSGEGRAAVAVRLTSKAGRAQLDVPLDVELRGSDGKTLYTNRTGGLERSLQSVAVLPAHASVWWVDDQVPSQSGKPAVEAKVGTGHLGRTAVDATTASLSVGEQSGIPVVSGRLVNRGRRARRQIAVYVVALKGARVTAAGRAVIATLAGDAGASASFQAFLVGSPAGAKIEATPGPGAG